MLGLQNTDKKMIESAKKYASLGFKVFPIKEGLKTPATTNGFKDATGDQSTISKYFDNIKNYNIAIRTGRESGIFCLDVDCKNGKNGFLWLEQQGEIPDTVIEVTPSGGKHYLFKMPDFFVGSNSDKLAEGIDIRAEGGYFVCSPSICGGSYEWMIGQEPGSIEIADAPQWLLDKLFELLPIEIPQNPQHTKYDEHLTIKQVMDFYKISLNEVKVGVFQGSHPIHGSSNGANFKIDTNKNVWACYRHTKNDGTPVGGGTLQLIALMEHIIDCEQCSKGALRGENFAKVLNVLKNKFKIDKEVAKNDGNNAMYEIAESIKDGDLGKDYIYCIEDNKHYCYEDNYWKNVHELEIELDLNNNMPVVKKHTPSMKSQIFHHMRVLLQKRMSVFNSTSLLNFPQGEFDPETKQLIPHVKEHYSTIRLPYTYDENATCDLWIKTLGEIFEGSQEKIDMMQEFFGYCLTSRMQLKKALLLLGESDTGKSTILFVFKAMIGTINYSTVALKNMGHPQYTPMMINKLVNIDTDVDKNAEAYEDNFKKITSYEEIECNQKYIETFSFVPKCRVILAANIFPKITDHSSAFYNRLIIIPCDRIFSKEEQDTELLGKLYEELSGIFNWCVEGYQRLKTRKKFKECDFSREAVEELEDTNNPSNLFFREHIEVCMGEFIEKGELFNHYKRWSDDNKQYTLTAAHFSVAIYKTFHKSTPKKTQHEGKRIWRNLKYVPFKNKDVADKGWQQ